MPPRPRKEDLRVLSVAGDAHEVTLARTPDSLLDGRYSLWFDAAAGHARLGEIVSSTADSVTRRVLAVDFGELAQARHARLGGWFYLRPQDLGLPFEDVQVATPLGPAPAWLVPAGADSQRWVIQVHGRAVDRRETLRAVPVFHAAGYTSLLISYRNDGEAPAGPDRRYGLGDTEWEDVAAAIEYAVGHGAAEVVLMGWSMGGAAVLQTVTRSPVAGIVRGVVLESPVVDWVSALDHQARLMRLPHSVARVVYALIGRSWGGVLTGQDRPIDLARLDFVRRAAELELPVLLLHSDDDDYVPATASRALARARDDIVTLVSFRRAGHTRLWNHDPERWNGAIADWLDSLAERG
jgi:dipeptidyl aminopeptidase/acylaminoacyl peptidase